MLNAAPQGVRYGLGVIWRNETRRDECGAIVAVRWMEQCGEGLGFRVPNPAERARATGRGGYYAALGLSQCGLFDLVGDHLDPDALLVRIGDPIVAWLNGGGVPDPPPVVTPTALRAIYARVAVQVEQGGCPVERDPFPADLRDALLNASNPPLAAEHGRGSE